MCDCDRQLTDGHAYCCHRCLASNGQSHTPRCNTTAATSVEGKVPQSLVWQVRLSAEWTRLTNNKENERCILEAEEAGKEAVEFQERGFIYLLDFVRLKQINTHSGRSLDVRLGECIEEEWKPLIVPTRRPRLQDLVERLLSSAVQVKTSELQEIYNEVERLTHDQVKDVFLDLVPGVESFLYRGMLGKYSLPMIIDAYFDGIPAFHDTPLQEHMLSLFRLVIHHGYDGELGGAQHLRDVAEAFMDCMAVQGRVVQRVAIEIQETASDFRGLVTRFAGSQKDIALKMLAIEHVRLGVAGDDMNKPTHYESRLTVDLGDELGLNVDDIRQACFDRQARRFAVLTGDNLQQASGRCRELFDLPALLQCLVAEINAFSTDSGPESMPCQFLSWAASNMKEPHAVFSKEDAQRVAVDEPFVLACLEMLFLGDVFSSAADSFRGKCIADLFGAREDSMQTDEVACDSLTSVTRLKKPLPMMMFSFGLLALSARILTQDL